MPYRIEGLAHKPFRPSNSEEGFLFQSYFCDRCIHDNYPDEPLCEIIGDSMAYKVEDEKYPKEWIHDGNGSPLCTKFEGG